jgi:16S rRNA (cytosine967-C5)-methyltransferase
LVYGVQRRRLTLARLLRPFVQRPLHKVESWIWEALRLGAYQLTLLQHVPPHAALNETVELAEEIGKPRGKGFLNAVLRKLADTVTDEFSPSPAPNHVPLGDGLYRVLRKPLLPDPVAERLEYVSAAFALPLWLVKRWDSRRTAETESEWDLSRLGFWFGGPAPSWLRANTLRTTRDALLLALRESGVQAEAGAHPESIKLLQPRAPRDLPGFDQGWFAMQDLASMTSVSLLNPRSGTRVLDLCAAPGGKTTHIAACMGDRGEIVASDVDQSRLRSLRELAQRLGATSIKTVLMKDADDPPKGPFDYILVDAPCSNTGVLGRRPEVRWRLRAEHIEQMVPTQTKLLIYAAERIRPGGSIVYSTCSIEPEENEQVVSNVLLAFPDLELKEQHTSLPGLPADGGYRALLRRRSLRDEQP